MKRKLSISVLLGLLVLVLFSGLNTLPVLGAAGTTGAVSAPNSGAEGNWISARFYDMTVSAEYAIVVNDVAVFNWTTTASETSRHMNIKIDESGSTGYMKIELDDGAAVTIATAYVQVDEPDAGIPADSFQAALPGLFIFGIVALVFGAIVAAVKKK